MRVVLLLAVLVGCSSPRKPAEAEEVTPQGEVVVGGSSCAPGATMGCACPDGASGVQICTQSGVGYTACDCSQVEGTAGAAGMSVPLAGDGGPSPVEAGPLEPDDPGVIVAEPTDEAAYIFDQSQLRTYELNIAPNDRSTMDANPSAEVYVPATFSFEGTDVPVGVRYKGSVGAFLSPCSSGNLLSPVGPKTGKCSIKVSFNWMAPGERFYGLKKLNFHSMNHDPSLMRDRLGYSLFRQFGVPAPRAVHARLMINGQLEGLFVVVEQVDGRFTRARFTEGGQCNLYKEIWPVHHDAQAYINALESNQDQNPSAQKMIQFKEAVNSGPAEVEKWVDRQLTMKYVAADRVMINDDGAFHWWCAPGGQGNNPGPNGNHNYYWYEATTASRMWIIPWDMDNSFDAGSIVHIDPEWRAAGSCSCGSPAGQRASSCDTLIGMWGSDWNGDYEAAVDSFLEGPFRGNNISEKLDAWEAQIAGAVTEAANSGANGSISGSNWQSGLSDLKGIINAARQNRGYNY